MLFTSYLTHSFVGVNSVSVSVKPKKTLPLPLTFLAQKLQLCFALVYEVLLKCLIMLLPALVNSKVLAVVVPSGATSSLSVIVCIEPPFNTVQLLKVLLYKQPFVRCGSSNSPPLE